MSADEALRDGLTADVEQMDAVIRQLLDYARIDESETAVSTDVQLLVQEVVQQFTAQAKSLVLDLQKVLHIFVRPLLLKRALANLLDNAINRGK